jgi:hypothetical protein
MNAVERYRLLLSSSLPELLAADYRAGQLTDVEIEQVVRARGLPEETIARVKNGETDRVEPKKLIVLPSEVANEYGTTNSKASKPSGVRGTSPVFGGQNRSVPPTVHATIDLGVMTAGTRWKPRRMACIERRGSEPIEHVVKIARDPASAAALISEWVAGGLLIAGGVTALEPKRVVVGRDFANVPAGVHFGTAFRADLENVPEKITVEALADPQQLVDLWVFDSWLCNIDRDALGNLLAARDADGKLSLVAVDQSDCFGGNAALTGGGWRKILRERGAASSIACLHQAILRAGGAAAIERALDKVDAAVAQLDAILAAVPSHWLELGGLHREELRTALRDRRLHLDRILALDHWRNLPA